MSMRPITCQEIKYILFDLVSNKYITTLRGSYKLTENPVECEMYKRRRKVSEYFQVRKTFQPIWIRVIVNYEISQWSF